MINRRTALLAGGVGGMTALSGCVGFVTGSSPAEFTASPATVPEVVLAETGYSLRNSDEMVIREPVDVLGISREVVVTNFIVEWEKAVELDVIGDQQAAVFTALTTPQVEILGREFNPIGQMSTRELAQLVQDEYDDFGDLSHVRDSDVRIDGEETTRSTYRTDASLTGIDEVVELTVHLTQAAELGEDLVVTVAVYPSVADEEDTVVSLIEAIEPTD